MGLGGFPALSLAEAREKAATARKLVLEGQDPIEARKTSEEENTAAPVRTFRMAAQALIETKRPTWKNEKHAAQWAATLETYAFPSIGDQDVASIDTEAILAILKPIWIEKTETASRVRGRIETVLDYARVRQWRTGDNPARWKGNLDHLLPARGKIAPAGHHQALPYTDLPDFWLRLQAADGMGAHALGFLILTAARTGEILGARWDEIDLDGKVWCVPADRMKAGRAHKVPLAAPALTVLRKMDSIRMGSFVFPGRGDAPLSNMTMNATLRRIGVSAVPHGFRATFRTWVAECTDYPFEVAEAALAHTIPNKVVAAYQRGDLFDKRRRLMAEWATFVCQKGDAS
jgi:integrase